MPSLTIENYVKTIWDICSREEGCSAATGQVAQALKVSPGTVTSMLKALSDSGLAVYTPYEGVLLTDAGRLLAMRVIRRHRLIELFLVRTLRLSWDEVHEEAENMEHAVSDFLIDRIDAFLEFPESDPHGDPIPKADGTLVTHSNHKLSSATPRSRFRIVRVIDQSPEFLRYLSESGVALGTEGRLLDVQPQAGTVSLVVNGSPLTLSRAAAEKISIDIL